MRQIISIISTTFLFIITLNSCSNNDNIDDYKIVAEGITVTVNGTKKIFNEISVEQTVFEEGTANEYTSLLVKARITPNSIEHMSFSLLKGKVGIPINSLLYVDSEDRIYYFNRSTDGGNFNINVTLNDLNNLIQGKFYGTLQENGGGTILKFEKGSFNIKY